MDRHVLPITYRLGQRQVTGETTYLDAGASVFVLTSCSAELGFELRGAYLAAERRGEILVAESGVLRSQPAELSSRFLIDSEEALIYERRRLLYDHLQAVQDLAALAGWALAVDGLDAAAIALDSGAATPPAP